MKQFLESENLVDTVIAQAQLNAAEARSVVDGLNETQLNWKPAPDKWSIAQCLEHLTAASCGFNPYFVAALARARRRFAASSPPAYQPTFMGRWLIKHVEPESPRKLRAPRIFKPSASNVQDALDNFLAQQKIFLKFVGQTSGIDYNRTRLRSPVTPLVRYSLADAYVITVSHEQRHLQQARRVRETSGFPN
ncbi:MAG TPA: DinB family protein [Pyrinomonadaceae bacterium]|nr:DinB family protein [Pyrinomonadaceae bacterium]